MKKIIFSIVFLFTITGVFSQEDAWVYFTDKPDATYYLANPLEMLTQRSLDRRTAQGITLDNTDVPVSTTYISQVESAVGITVMAKSKWMNALHVRGALTDIQALTSLSFVSSIQYANHSLNTRISTSQSEISTTLNRTTETQNAQIVYNYGGSANQIEMLNGHLLHQQDYTGQGKIIAVFDGGFIDVNTAQPFQHLFANGQILGGYNFPDADTNIYNHDTHGTKVMSVMAGMKDNELIGTAPGAQYYLFRTESGSYENPVEESYWVEAAELADYYGVDVINSSLGYADYDNPAYSYTYAMRNGQVSFASRGASIAFQKGMVCVISAGNNGAGAEPHILIPSDADNVLTVGAVDSAEAIATFSAIGYTSDGRVKPDVCAKGVGVSYCSATGTVWTGGNGTSFASPILAGMVATFWSAVPNLTAAQVIQLVKESADQYATPDIYKGYGVPDFQVALTNGIALNTEDFQKETITLYPNPMQSNLTINFNDEGSGVLEIFNQFGQSVLYNKVSPQNNTTNVSSLASGVYFYSLTFNNEVLKGKLIKQ